MFATNINNKGFAEKNARVKVGLCKFPFKYKGKMYTKCYPTKKGKICATRRSRFKTLKKYGYCPTKRRKRRTQKDNKKGTKKKAPKKVLKIVKPHPKKRTKKETLKKLKKKQIKHKVKTTDKMKRLNESLIKLLSDLEILMNMKGQRHRAMAYAKAQETLLLELDDITDIAQLKGKPRIGKTILGKFDEFVRTGTLKILEAAKHNPIYLFAKIHGIGPKKAKELVEKEGITTLRELEKRKNEVLNDIQLKGLQYLNDIEKRIPRDEIQRFEKRLTKEFKKIKFPGSEFEIVGSYRRKAASSGDIDIIVTDKNGKKEIFHKLIDTLIQKGIIISVLSKGKVKSMVIGKLPGSPARRIDFMYTPYKEFPFAILYFTGSKGFNVTMRELARKLGFSMNEHKFTRLNSKDKLNLKFPTEKSIFDFLGLEYKEPHERKDGRAIIKKTSLPLVEEPPPIQVKEKKQTLKKKKGPSAKSLLKGFKTDGAALLDLLSEKELASMVHVANNYYFNKGKSLVTDSEYDIIKEYLAAKYPDNMVLLEVGAPIKKNDVTLPYYMPSMDKIKPDTKKIITWKKKYKGPYEISAKLDGVSALYTTQGEPKLYTRGNGIKGKNISHLIPFLQLPSKKGVVLRGELMVSTAVFQTTYDKAVLGDKNGYANPRSAVVGIVNATEQNVQKYSTIDFVGYEVIQPRLKPSRQMEFLKKNSVITVKHKLVPDVTNEMLSDILVDWRNTYKYLIDGIIIIDNHSYKRTKKNPKHAFAFKMVLSDQKAEAKVVDVIWKPSKDGFIKPKIRIEPIHIGGTEITAATAYNADYIQKNNIGIGAIVEIIRSGDVIPTIQKVISPAPQAKMPPPPWHWNETHTDIILDNIKDNESVKLKKLIHFFNILDVEGMREGNIKRLVKKGFNTIEKIILMSKADLLTIDGFKEKMAQKIYSSIHTQLENAPIEDIMAATNIFGRGMGRRRLHAILSVYPKIINKNTKVQDIETKIEGIKGFGKKTARDFIKHLKQFKGFMKKIHLEKRLKIKKKKQNISHPLYNKKILMTGFRDNDLQEAIIKVTGIPMASNVSNNTFIVLVADLDEDTTKANDARDKNITIMTPEHFKKKYHLK